MAPTDRRAICVHTTAGAVLQYRHVEKLVNFIIGRAASLAFSAVYKTLVITFTALQRTEISWIAYQLRCWLLRLGFKLLRQPLTRQLSSKPYFGGPGLQTGGTRAAR